MSELKTPPLYFDPDHHPDDTLKSFVEFIQDFELRYNATYPDPPKVSLDSAIQRWKYGNDNKNPTLIEYDTIVEEWKSKDKVSKFLGIYSSRRLFGDWVAAVPVEVERKVATWSTFTTRMQEYYKPTENLTLKNFQFRTLSQEKEETFAAYCNRAEKEAKHCQFKCDSANCSAERIAVRDQIIIGMTSDEIRQEALKNSWDLADLRKEGMRLESAAKSASEISGDLRVNKMGKYSFKNSKKKETNRRDKKEKIANCFFCGLAGAKQDIIAHAKQCPAKSAVCTSCNRTGHYSKVCRSGNSVKGMRAVDHEESEDEPVYNVNIFRLSSAEKESKSKIDDFKVQMVINNHLGKVLADTGAGVSVCGISTARRWNLLERMTKTNARIKPYKSKAIPAIGMSTCAVSFGDRTVPVQWHIINESCEPVLAGTKAIHLGIIKFKHSPETFMPIHMIKMDAKKEIQDILAEFPETFDGVGKLVNHTVELHVDESVKSVAEPPRRIPYHLTSRVDEAINEMISNDVIEEHPKGEPAPWVSNIVIAPKDDGDIRITLDAKNLNKAIQASNFPIPRHEDIKAKLSGSKFFSKLDLKSAFWQLEIAEQSRHLTVFHSGGKLYRYKRLVMGLKPAQGELNAALQPLFANIPQVHIIHDDLIIATDTQSEHIEVIKEVMKILSANGLTLNGKKCVFGQNEIKFWGLIFSSDGVCPDPDKVEALDHLTSPTSKEELISFLCMMQSNADFIPGFAKKTSTLRELTKKESKFKWEKKHENCFKELVQSFRKDVLLQYFDVNLQTFIFVDAHQTGLSAMLAQGKSVDEARPVAVASRTTNHAEQHYPQLDLEATSVDFGLRRFREYIVGSPSLVKIITDHKPLVSIFSGRRSGSIRTQRIKLNHQDVPYITEYRKGKLNLADYMSRHAKQLSKLPSYQQKECQELNNLLYMLHTTPIIDHISLAAISQKTKTDTVLSKVQKIVKNGQKWIPKKESIEVKKFEHILPELTMTGNGILLKGERIVLPDSLQEEAIRLAHRGAHPGQSGIERRLRYHFFFHGMYEKVRKFVQQCKGCSLFVDKKTKEPIKHHIVPQKCWETVAVDLFGPMPSSRHVVVVQDIGSRYPAAKLVTSTKADKVIPVLDEIYSSYGYPEVQISDNGPPFNSQKMKNYADGHGINVRFAPPYFPSANPAETFMKTVGKAMKITNHNKDSESEALQKTLVTYRQTPHPATDIPPANMLFRDGVRAHFPRKSSSDQEIQESRRKDNDNKVNNQEKINSSKYRKPSSFEPGDLVLVRDCNRKSKYDPKFHPNPFVVLEVDGESKKVMLKGWKEDKVLVRHLDDIKDYHRSIDSDEEQKDDTREGLLAEEEMIAQRALLDDLNFDSAAFSDMLRVQDNSDIPIEQGPGPSTEQDPTEAQQEVRRSTRNQKAPQRYIEEC